MVVVVGAVLRVTPENPGVPVLALQRLRPTLLTMAERFTPDEVAAVYELGRTVITDQREELIRLRGAGEIGDVAMNVSQRELDLEEERLDS